MELIHLFFASVHFLSAVVLLYVLWAQAFSRLSVLYCRLSITRGQGLSLAFYIVTCKSSEHRLSPLIDSWGHYLESQPRVQLFFLSIESSEFGWLANRSVPMLPKFTSFEDRMPGFGYYQIQARMTVKDAIFIDHCFRESKAQWCFRFTDDVFLNMPAFPDFLRWLEAIGNPNTDVMVIGNCVGGWYLQGGSGYGFSRAAAETFLGFVDDWLSNMHYEEDYYIGDAARRMGRSSAQCNSPFFSGHFLTEETWRNWNWSDPACFQKCPATLEPEPHCNHSIVPYHKGFIHHAMGWFMSQREWQKWMNDAPVNSMIWYKDGTFHICRGG
jgi:hypothetical protein